MTDQTRADRMDEERRQILGTLIEAVEHREQVLQIVSESVSQLDALAALTQVFGWSDANARAVLDMQVRRFSRLERERLVEEYEQLASKA